MDNNDESLTNGGSRHDNWARKQIFKLQRANEQDRNKRDKIQDADNVAHVNVYPNKDDLQPITNPMNNNVEPVESVKSVKSVEPVKPVEPVESVKSVESVESVEPVKSVESDKPVDDDDSDNENFFDSVDTADPVDDDITIIVSADDDHIKILNIVKDGENVFKNEIEDLFNEHHINVSLTHDPKWINRLNNTKYINIGSEKSPEIWVDKKNYKKRVDKFIHGKDISFYRNYLGTRGGAINTYYELRFKYNKISSKITFNSIKQLPNDYIPSRE